MDDLLDHYYHSIESYCGSGMTRLRLSLVCKEIQIPVDNTVYS